MLGRRNERFWKDAQGGGVEAPAPKPQLSASKLKMMAIVLLSIACVYGMSVMSGDEAAIEFLLKHQRGSSIRRDKIQDASIRHRLYITLSSDAKQDLDLVEDITRNEIDVDTRTSSEEEKLALEIMNSLDQNHSACPLRHDKIEFEDIKQELAKPYVFGEPARPSCGNCHRDDLWANFCQFKSSGPICPEWLKLQMLRTWVERAEQGSPGMRELLAMSPCDLFPFIRNRTLWLVGDSQTLGFDSLQNWSKAVQCFMYEFWDLNARDLPRIRDEEAFTGWCASLAQGSRICFVRANTGQDAIHRVLPNIVNLGGKLTDIVVLNFGLWHNDKVEFARNLTEFAQYYQRNYASLPKLFWRQAPTTHFSSPTGEYIWAHIDLGCREINGIELLPDNSLVATDPELQIMAEGGWRNKLADPLIESLGIPILKTWNVSLPMWQYHVNYSDKEGDCLHMCHPSAYQYWVFVLYQALREEYPELAANR